MNQQPHTHKLEIEKNYASVVPAYRITYGDQRMNVWTWLPGWQGRMSRKAKRIVATHDRESKRAHLTPEGVASVVTGKHNAVLTAKDTYGYHRELDAWGSDLLAPPATADA